MTPENVPDILTLIVSAVALAFSYVSFQRSRTVAMYQDVDMLYLELLKTSLDHPKFINPQLTRNYKEKFDGEDRLRYEQFAFMAWNICETIYDRRKIKEFFGTWECIIKVEDAIHRTWLEDEENRCRFKKEFVDYVVGQKKVAKELSLMRRLFGLKGKLGT